MAKDRRGDTRRRQVSLAQKAGTGSPAPHKQKKKKKRKVSPGKIVVIVLLTILIVVSLVFIIIVGKNVYDSLSSKKTVSEVDLNDYDTTPETDRDKVAYYLVGLLGDEETKAPTDMLALLCYDKQAKTLNVLQVPQNTYLGDSGSWAVKAIGDIWYNPKPLDWCDYCRKQVFEPEISDGKHTACGTAITQKTGSAVENLLQAFNEQYSMPVDYYFLLEKQTFIKLVNLVDGVDVNLEKDMKLSTIEYKAGVQTLDGASAYEYINLREKGVDGDVQRLVSQRQVFVGLLQRLTSRTEEDLTKNIIGPLMSGSTPIRTASDPESILSLLAAPTKENKEDWPASKYNQALSKLLTGLSKVPLANMTVYMLPGEAATSEKVAYFSPHKAELAALLQASFNPYGRAISETDLLLIELASNKEADLHKQTFAELAVSQTGEVTPTTTAAAS